MGVSKYFEGSTFAFELSSSTRFKEKQKLKNWICSALLLSEETKSCSKAQRADKLKIPKLQVGYIEACVEAGKKLQIGEFQIPSETGKSFAKGFVPNDLVVLNEKSAKLRKVFARIQRIEDTPLSQLDKFLGNLTVLKWIFLSMRNKESSVISVEIHESSVATEDPFRVAIYERQIATSFDPKYYYVSTIHAAADIFGQLVKDIKVRGYSETKRPSVCVGSDIISQKMLATTVEAEPIVLQVVSCLWQETIGAIDDLLDQNLENLQLAALDLAESYLAEMKILFRQSKNLNKEKLTSLSQNFSRELQLRRTIQISNPRELAKMFDFCQLVRDMLTVGESTNWNRNSSALAKYRSLGCYVADLSHQSDEFIAVKKKIPIESENVEIFRIHRPTERAHSDRDVDNCRLLFHGSKTENGIGILSRGLLPQKVSTQEFGVSQTDVGNLGCGVYFSDSFNTSLKYCDSEKSNLRIMFVSKVALGQIYETSTHMYNIEQPPNGFDSVHGVKRTSSKESAFEDDEFAIYKSSQQELQYLVVFTSSKDKQQTNAILKCQNLEGTDIAPNDTESENIVSAVDGLIIKDPWKSSKVGLISSKTDIPLEALHIRAKIVDLATEVTIYQVYQNKFGETAEVKYVFPLDDNAAICGFEAFINGKRIVGRVEEKQKARVEYKEAVEKGHGAYLMEAAKPDVLTMNIGNLPPGCTCVIKLTYVTEVTTEAEDLIFTIPSSLAPWDRSEAQKQAESIQDTTKVFSMLDLPPRSTSLKVSVEMPHLIKRIYSPSHAIKTKKTDQKAVVELTDKLSSNFRLIINLAEVHEPRLWIEQHPILNSQATMVVFYPEFETPKDPLPDVTIMLDMSNSMIGSTATIAKQISMLFVSQLAEHFKDGTIFNVVRFGSVCEEAFPVSEVMNKKTIAAAQKFIEDSRANMGNTDISDALLGATVKRHNFVNNIILISDGHIRRTNEVLQLCHRLASKIRIFSCSVSETANVHLLKSISSVTGGAHEKFDQQNWTWLAKVNRQLNRVCQPCLNNVRIQWHTSSMEEDSEESISLTEAPSLMANVFNGERTVAYGFKQHCYQATLTAEVGGQEFKTLVTATDLGNTSGKTLHCLTTKAIIKDWLSGNLDIRPWENEIRKRQLVEYITELSKKHSVVCPTLTSFIAIEERVENEIIQKSFDVMNLLNTADNDILPYLGWDDEEHAAGGAQVLDQLITRAKVSAQVSVSEAEKQFEAVQKLLSNLPGSSPLKLRASLELASFYREILGDHVRAKQMAKSAFNGKRK